MSLIRISLLSPGVSGLVPARGSVEFRPSSRRILPSQQIVLPDAFSVQLVNGEALVELESTTNYWVWEAREHIVGGTRRYFIVPETDETLQYSALSDVDPSTLQPEAQPEAVWYTLLSSEVADLQEQIDNIEVGSGGASGLPPAPEMRVNSGFIQFKHQATSTWTNLIAVADLQGAQGTPGTPGTNGREVQLQKTVTHVQWRYVGDVTWNNLIALAEITGPQGVAGTNGTNGTPGTDGEDGASAYEIAVANGFVGTEAQWLSSLTGPIGPQGPPGTGGTGGDFAVVNVVTGNEDRPEATIVHWYGGDTEPINMDDLDIWFTSTVVVPPSDTTPPSTPTALSSSSVTQTSFNVSWNASTDNVGVVEYDVLLNGTFYGTTSSTNISVTGRTADTTYNVTVIARDAADNESSPSTALPVTTEAASSFPEHSIWASAAYPYTLTKGTDGTPNIQVANGFYTFDASSTSGWKVAGMRIWIPTGVSMASTATCRLFIPGSGADVPPDLSTTPTAQKVATGLVSGQWNDVRFDSPIPINPSQAFWLTYDFGDGTYLAAASGTPTEFVQASDGSKVVLAESTLSETAKRAHFRIGTGSTSIGGIGATGYGIDCIVQED